MTQSWRRWLRFCALLSILTLVVALGSCKQSPRPGEVQDEARLAGRAASSFPAADEDYFHDMDQDAHGNLALNSDEIKGRNMWLVWTGGNDRIWDTMTVPSVGHLGSAENDFVVPGAEGQPRQSLGLSRPGQRAVLQAAYRARSRIVTACGWTLAIPAVRLIRSRMKEISRREDWRSREEYSGRLVLRLRHRHRRPAAVPQSRLRRSAAKKWDPKRYYSDPNYYNDKNLVRPYRVGMTCGFCHVGPSPINPPADPENPKWENLSSNVGAQYFWIDRIFAWDLGHSNFPVQLFHTSRPGTLDTSLISTDSINNPRTMNAVYALLARLDVAKRWGKETLAGGELNNKQFKDYVHQGPLMRVLPAAEHCLDRAHPEGRV